MTFSQKLLDITFRLAQGKFTESGTDTVTLSGLRASAHISKAGTPNMSTLQLSVWGMTRSMMNQLSTLGMRLPVGSVARNFVTLTAGDNVRGQGTAFIGTIISAYGDFNAAPDVAFRVEAYTGAVESATSAVPSSYRGKVAVATIMANLAAQMGLGFENNGVNASLTNPYLTGSAWQQAQRAAEAAGIEWNIVDDTGTPALAIWPEGGARNGVIPEIGPDSGLVGYPTFDAYGLRAKIQYLPFVRFAGQVKIVSTLPAASKIWTVYSMSHFLESQVPHGRWESEIGCFDPNFGPFPVAA